MMLNKSLIFFVAFFVVQCNSTLVYDCLRNGTFEDNVKISDCQVPPCVIKKGTSFSIEQKLVPNHEIKYLKTSVHTECIQNVQLLFRRDNGDSACGRIYHMDGSKATCLLKSGTEYVYKTSYHIQKDYPTMLVEMEWALKEGNTTITCFKVLASIRS